MRKLKTILQSKYLFKILALFLLIASYLYTAYYPFKSKYQEKDNTFIGVVKSYKIKDNNIIIHLKAKEEIIVYYNYHNIDVNNLLLGDTLKINGTIFKPSKSTNFNTFDYSKYLYHKKIYNLVKASSINKIGNNRNIIYTIRNIIRNKINNYKSKDYINTLLLGNNTLDNDIKENYQSIGISHLFSASGMHVNLIISLLYYYLNKISYNKKIKYILSDILLIVYLMIAFSSSLLRSVITYLLFTLNDILKLNIKKMDLLFLTLVIAIIINPFIIYDIGFIYSYLISFFISIFYKKNNNKLLNIILVAVISFLVSFPISIYINYEVNFLSIITNILLTPILSIILLPICILSIFIPILDNLLYLITSNLEILSNHIANINTFKLVLTKPSILVIIIYFLVIIFILKKRKYYYLLIIVVLIHNFYPYFNSTLEVTMFDVKEGDSLLIHLPYNKGNIIIDTGSENEYLTKNEIIRYLKSKGIKHIDFLIISHGDEDHIGNADILINNYKVNKVILNNGNYNKEEKNIIKLLNKKNIKYYKSVNKLCIKKHKLYFLNTKEYDNENDNSNVIYANIGGYKFLFMGDAEEDKEKDTIAKYKISDIDFLKVGHHGSNTSSSKKFIDSIKPKNCLISVGKNNRYGHPKKSVIDTLDNYCDIYRTDLNGSIEVKINRGKYKIRTIN